MDQFTLAYITCALWSSTDESTPQGGEPLDSNYSAEDLAPETLARIQTDCARFQAENSDTIAVGDIERAGHDFWLTRNGHGAGFWDGDWPEPQATQLTIASRRFGECYLYVGDDNHIHAV